MQDQIAHAPIDKYGASLFFFGDLQWGATGFSEEAWEEFKDEFLSTPNARAIGLGDYNDSQRPSIRSRLRGAIDSDTHVQLDDQYRSHQDKLLNKMAFLEGKLLGIHNGHHCHIFADGTNSDQRIASALRTTYLDWEAATRLVLFHPKLPEQQRWIYNIVSMHGTGNGRTTGSDVGFLERQASAYVNADHIVKGHACRSNASMPYERHFIRESGPAGRIRRYVRLLSVGGFRKGFTNGATSGYEEIAGFVPQPIGWAVIRFSLVYSKEAMRDRGLDGNKKPKNALLKVEHVNHHPLIP